MTPQRTQVVLLAALPAMLAPMGILLIQNHEAPIFLGLSGRFWAGALISVSLVVLAVAAYKFKRLSSRR